MPPASPPTWTIIFNKHLQPKCKSCHEHAGNMFSAAKAYDYLQSQGQINSANPTASAIVDPAYSELTWFSRGPQANMPPNNLCDEQAAIEIAAWVKAGAPNN